ncbi:MAG: 1-deoxy-D-xylulose-5-phosphate reductoisomerase [Pirellulaceae bacterium]
MNKSARSIVILGATGSIGRNALAVAEASEGRIRVVGLSAHSSLQQLCDHAQRVGAKWVVATEPAEATRFDWSCLPKNVQVSMGQLGVEALVAEPEVDVVVVAIVGSVGLRGTWAALEAGKTVALANKETLVMAGPLVTQLAKERKTAILPIDSEHSAVFQCLQAGRKSDVERIILTASGGPFRSYSAAQLKRVTVEEALAHPTWDMGPKITVDSATMMNKALEIIEARWLFDVSPDQIDVVIHPQSIVHSMVEFRDGAVVAQLSPPDMKLPIQYALSYPDRWASPAAKLDWTTAMSLEFEPPDVQRFPALELGFEVARAGGTAGAVVNAANEMAVAGFLDGHLEFAEIVPVCRSVLEQHEFDASPTLEQLIGLDAWARREVTRWVCT